MISIGDGSKLSSGISIEDCDIVDFTPNKLMVFKFEDEEVKALPPNQLGYNFYIVHWKIKNVSLRKKEVFDQDVFEAVLLDPVLYANNIRENGYNGLIMKANMETTFEEFKEAVEDMDIFLKTLKGKKL